MADKKHWLDWLAMGISLLSLAVSGLSAYRTVLFPFFSVTTFGLLWVTR
jgi:hypothetical protein